MAKLARVAVWFDTEEAGKRWNYGVNVFEKFVGEILAQRSVPFQWIDGTLEQDLASFDLVIAALTNEREETQATLLRYMENGGTIVSYGGLNGLAKAMKCRLLPYPDIGYAELSSSFTSLRELRYLTCRPWIQDSTEGAGIAADGLLSASGETQAASRVPALLSIPVGSGFLERWAVNIPQTVVRLQQGSRPVFEDGVPAPDGTAELQEGILKPDDQCEMDWERDRLVTKAGTPYFAFPYADYWKEVLIGHLVKVCAAKNRTLPVADLLPDGTEAVALVSHDSDMNDNDSARTTLEQLVLNGIRSSWCILQPGFEPGIYELVKEQRHDLGLHFNALRKQGGEWSQGAFDRQCAWLKEAAGIDTIPFNKNHYTCFEGWDELFDWCERNGIALDQTRGPSKTGNVGFPFGTCTPYYPISSFLQKNRSFRVLELGFLTQDMGLEGWGDVTAIRPLLEKVKEVRGIAHFLFHQIHIHTDPKVREGLKQVAEEARSLGFEFWTTSQMLKWEADRRAIRWEETEDGSANPSWDGEETLVVYLPLADSEYAGEEETVHRFGHPCIRRTISRVTV